MKYQPKPQPALKGPNKAIKGPLKWLASCLFLFSILFFATPALAEYLEWDFADYSYGAFDSGSIGWTKEGSETLLIKDILAQKNLGRARSNTADVYYGYQATSSKAQLQETGIIGLAGIITLDRQTTTYTPDFYFGPFQSVSNNTNESPCFIHISSDAGKSTWQVGTTAFGSNLYNDTLADGTYDWSINWDSNASTCDFVFHEQSTSTAQNGAFDIDSVATFGFSFTDRSYTFGWRADNGVSFVGYGLKECSDLIAEAECEANPNCEWYFSEWLFNSGLTPYEDCQTKESVASMCGDTWLTCNYCITETACEDQGCYWNGSECYYGTGECGEGLELQFCDNEGDCETAGGYWYDDYCWLSAGTEVSSFDDYYAEYGDYATPTAWISDLADGTGGFFNSIGGFLSTFKAFFDLRKAIDYGKIFGGAIPTALSYLKIINDFCGGFPVASLFIFALGFMLAIGVFRIVRNLVQLVKFW
jgi:hypothetical protein